MTETSDLRDELRKVEAVLEAQETLRGILPDDQLEAAIAPLREKCEALLVSLSVSGDVVGGDKIGGDKVNGDKVEGGTVIFAKDGATVVVGEAPVTMTAVDRASALGRYLQHVISRNRYLQLQGIRSGGKLVHIELDRIYITLRATRQRVVEAEEMWLETEARLAPGEMHRLRERAGTTTETVTVSVNEALASHSRLAVLGDPGVGVRPEAVGMSACHGL